MAGTEHECNHMVRTFISICDNINCPVSEEKTELADNLMIFLGILLDGKNQLLMVPQEKKTKAINIINYVVSQRKITIKTVQKLTGILNFLQRAIVPGRTFTRRMYDKLKIRDKDGNPLKQYHLVL